MACTWAWPHPLTETYGIVSLVTVSAVPVAKMCWGLPRHSSKASEPLLKSLGRETWVDSLRFILMIFILMGHYVAIPCSYIAEQSYWLSPLLVWINLFVMPGFAALSGYLSKAPLTEARVSRLLVFVFFPYVFSKVIYWLWSSVEFRTLGAFDPFDAFSNSFGLEWYLIVLVQWRLAIVLMRPFGTWTFVSIAIFIGLVSGNWVPSGSALALHRACSFFPFFVLGYLMDLGHLRNILNRSSVGKIALRMVFVGFLLMLFYCPGIARLFMANTLGDLNFDYQSAIPSIASTSEQANLYPNGFVPVLAPSPRSTCGSEWALSFVHRLIRYQLGVILLLGLLSWTPASPALAMYGQHTMYPYLLHPWIFQILVLPTMQRHMPLLVQSLHSFSSGGYVWAYAVLLAPVLTLGLSSTLVRRITWVFIEPTWIASRLLSSELSETLDCSKSENQRKDSSALEETPMMSKAYWSICDGRLEGLIAADGYLDGYLRTFRMTVEQAKVEASRIQGCTGFCHRGDPTSSEVEIYFMRESNVQCIPAEKWTSYLQIDKVTV